MAQRFQNPFPEWIASTVARLEGYKLFFYESGTSTKLDTYKVAALTGGQENTNPVVLDEFGRPPFSIFLKNQDYKVVLASSDSADPPAGADIVWTADPVRASDFATFPIFLSGSGSPSGVVAGTAGSSGVQPTMYWDYTNSVLYVCTTTGDATNAVWTALNQASTVAVPPPQGRLTLVSGIPIITSDQIAATVVYYTPYVGDLVPIYNGATFSATSFTQLTLTLASQHLANTLYDIFVFSNDGVLTLVTGPAWSNSTAGSCARSTGVGTTQLTRVGGFWLNAVQITGRNGATTYTIAANRATYVGSIWMDGTNGQVTCHLGYGKSRKWGLWNAFNRMPVTLKAGDATASWTYSTASIRSSNNDATNKLTAFFGLAEEQIDVRFQQEVGQGGGSAGTVSIGIGINSASVSGFGPDVIVGNGGRDVAIARYIDTPKLGINDYRMLESGGGAGTTTWFGDEISQLMTGRYLA